MPCPAHNRKLTPAACPEHILSIADGRELLRCRACPRGQALMATVRISDSFYGPEEGCAPNTEENQVKKQTYTAKELAALLGLSPKDVTNAKYVKSKTPCPAQRWPRCGKVWPPMALPGTRSAPRAARNPGP